MTIKIMDPERFTAVMEFALQAGAAPFFERLECLSTYAGGE
jgi:hypothetical protein